MTTVLLVVACIFALMVLPAVTIGAALGYWIGDAAGAIVGGIIGALFQ